MEQRRMDYHLHTLHSFDGEQSMEELCADMVSRGVQEICLTEHIEPGHPDDGVDVPPIWDVWFQEIEAMRRQYPMLTIRAGVEIGDNAPLRDRIMADLDQLPLDFRLLSLHLVNGVDCYAVDKYFAGKSRAQAYREYAEAKAESILAWEDFDSVAHIGYVAKYSAYTGEERPLRYEDAPDAFDAILRHIIRLDKCLEINTSGYGKLGNFIPHPSIVKRYIDLGGECFTFGSDSHSVERNYADVNRAREQVRALGGKYQAGYEKRKKYIHKI
ncbi:MAG: histidinol-phosphatase HisJ family protein [Aristaeellaceae bacterium]